MFVEEIILILAFKKSWTYANQIVSQVFDWMA